jgi:hypothetical protein
MSNTDTHRPQKIQQADPKTPRVKRGSGADVILLTSGSNSDLGRAKHLRRQAAGKRRQRNKQFCREVVKMVKRKDIKNAAVKPIRADRRNVGRRAVEGYPLSA